MWKWEWEVFFLLFVGFVGESFSVCGVGEFFREVLSVVSCRVWKVNFDSVLRGVRDKLEYKNWRSCTSKSCASFGTSLFNFEVYMQRLWGSEWGVVCCYPDRGAKISYLSWSHNSYYFRVKFERSVDLMLAFWETKLHLVFTFVWEKL